MAEQRGTRQIAVAGLLGAAFAVVIILVSSGGNVERMTFGDGRLHRAVAQDLNADDPDIQAVVGGSGPALRYGRIGLPVVLWSLSAGSHAAMRYVQPLIMIVTAAAIAMAARVLVPAGSIATALTPFVAVGLTVSLAGGFAEPLSIALALWAIILVQRRNHVSAAVLFSAAMLSRENAAAVLCGVALWIFFHGRRRGAVVLLSAGVPVIAWHLIVADRFGYLPLRDPWLLDSGSLGAPVVSIIDALGKVDAAGVALIAVHVALAVIAFRLWRSSILGAAAAASAIPVLSVGEYTWRYLGDAARLGAFLEVLVILGLVERAIRSRAISRVEAPELAVGTNQIRP